MKQLAFLVVMTAIFATSCEQVISRAGHRAAAEWVFSHGGTVNISGTSLELSSASDLPEEPFEVLRINLNQTETPITDTDLEELPEPGRLEYLGLHSARITNKGIDHLLHLRSLQELELSYTEIGDEGLDKLQELLNLSTLHLWGTRVTDDAVERFQSKHADCKVIRD